MLCGYHFAIKLNFATAHMYSLVSVPDQQCSRQYGDNQFGVSRVLCQPLVRLCAVQDLPKQGGNYCQNQTQQITEHLQCLRCVAVG